MYSRTPYEILGVAKDATAAEINTAYRALALQYHPDRNPGDAEALEKFKEVNDANGILSDEAKRREYDRTPRETVSAHDVAYFRSRPDYARLALREFQENGYIEFARDKRSFRRGWRAGKLALSVELHCKPLKEIPALALEECRNALEALEASDVTMTSDSKNPADKAVISFSLEDNPQENTGISRDDVSPRKVHELVAFIDQYWNDLFFKQPSGVRSLGAGTASVTARAALTPCDYYLTKSCLVAGFDDVCSLRLAKDAQLRKEIVASFKAGWSLVQPKDGGAYAAVDLSALPPLAGFEGLDQTGLRHYYENVLTDLAGLYLFDPKTFVAVDPQTGKPKKSSHHFAIMDCERYERLHKAGLIPETVAAGVCFDPAALRGQGMSEEARRKQFEQEADKRIEWENVEDSVELSKTALIKNIRWTLVGRKGSKIKYAVADFSQVPIPEEYEDMPPSVLRTCYKETLTHYLCENEIDERLHNSEIFARAFAPIDPNTGEFTEQSNHYAVIDPKVITMLRNQSLIPSRVANKVNFSETGKRGLTTHEEKRRLDEEFEALILHAMNYPAWNDEDGLRGSLRVIPWEIVRVEGTEMKQLVADFGRLPPIREFEGASPELVPRFYKAMLQNLILPAKLSDRTFAPIDPRTGAKTEESDHYAVLDRRVYQALLNNGLVPSTIANEVNFGDAAGKVRRSREQERGDRGV